MPDFHITYLGSYNFLTPNSGEAQVWLEENIGEGATYYGGSLVVETRYLPAILNGIQEDGLTTE